MIPLVPNRRGPPPMEAFPMNTKHEDETTSTTEASDSSNLDVYRNTETSGESKNDVKTVKNLARNETGDMRTSRRILISFMILTGALVSASVFVGVQERDVDDSAETFKTVTQALADTYQTKLATIDEAFNCMSETITSAALVEHEEEFPYVTIHQFEVAGHVARTLSGIDRFLFAPYLHPQSEGMWAAYSSKKAKEWLPLSRAALMADKEDFSKSNANPSDEIWPDIFEWVPQSDGHSKRKRSYNAPYAPIWQVSPPPPDPLKTINLNLLANPTLSRLSDGFFCLSFHADPLISEAMPHLRAVLGGNPDDLPAAKNSDEVKMKLHDRPISAFAQPVLHHPERARDKQSFAGVVLGEVDWDRLFFEGEMPRGSGGVYMVLRNTCSEAFTYFVNKNETAEYLGVGDLHETGFEDTEVTVSLSTTSAENEDIKGHCIYSVSFYSSPQFRHKFKKDLWFAPCIAIAFLLVNFAFIRYDRAVVRRLDKVIRTAARFNSILGRMYSSNLRSMATVASPKKVKPPSRQEWRLSILEDDSCSAIEEEGEEEEALVEQTTV